MDQVPIEQLVGAAGGTATVQKDGGTKFHLSAAALQWLVDYVRNSEREACAKVCDELHWPWHMGDNSGPKECAVAIRARGQA